MSGPAELFGQYLQQRHELGDRELYLDSLTALAVKRALKGQPESTADAQGSAENEPADLFQIGDMDELRHLALGCRRCGLAERRQHVVFGEGSLQAELIVVGEAPGAEEDAKGRPFVGRAGKLLNLLLASIGFEREQVYICNVLKCRPPGNRNPQPDEVATCSPYLRRQVDLIRPRVILACGTFAAHTLLETTIPISRLRGGDHSFRGIPLVATYHPAALLRNAAWVRLAWEDLQRLRAVLEAA